MLPQALEHPATLTLHMGQPDSMTRGSHPTPLRRTHMQALAHTLMGTGAPTWLVQALHRYTQVPSPTLSTLRDDQSTRFR